MTMGNIITLTSMTFGIILFLFLLGLLLILVEIFITPGFIVGILGIGAISGSVYMTFNNYGPQKGWLFLGIATVILVTMIVIALRSGVWQKWALKDNVSGSINVNDAFMPEMGMEGVALSALRPMGKAEINDEIVEVQTESDFIDAKTPIKVSKIVDNKIYVIKS
jgi:membrane-bound ClpP family serine protease